MLVACLPAHLSARTDLFHIPNTFSIHCTADNARMVSFPALNGPDGLKALNDHLLTRSYVVG